MVRKATMQDIPRIAEIIIFGKRVAYRPIFRNDLVSFNELRVIDIIEDYRKNPSLIENMIVYDDGIIKGILNRNFVDDTVEFSEFYIEPFFKRQGIGTELIQHAIFEAKRDHKKKIFLWVIQDNVSARKFYEANGFIEGGETRPIEGTSKMDVHYELTLL